MTTFSTDVLQRHFLCLNHFRNRTILNQQTQMQVLFLKFKVLTKRKSATSIIKTQNEQVEMKKQIKC